MKFIYIARLFSSSLDSLLSSNVISLYTAITRPNSHYITYFRLRTSFPSRAIPPKPTAWKSGKEHICVVGEARGRGGRRRVGRRGGTVGFTQNLLDSINTQSKPLTFKLHTNSFVSNHYTSKIFCIQPSHVQNLLHLPVNQPKSFIFKSQTIKIFCILTL